MSPRHTPQPDYPQSLRGSRLSGKVKVQYRIRADGAVTDVVVLESSHPEFTREVEHTLARWEYHPWSANGENPTTLDIILPIVFTGSQTDAREVRLANARSKGCADLIRERAQFADQAAWGEEVQMDSFQHLLKQLNLALVSGAVSYQAHLARVAQLETAWPQVLAKCEKQPERQFTEWLPAPNQSG